MCVSIFCFGLPARSDELSDALALIDAGQLSQAVQKLAALADRGNPTAQYKLAQMYYFGRGVDKDLARAAFLFEAAAGQNIMNAEQNIAVMYLRGEGVQRDLQKAIYWFHQAASQGDAFAQVSLGLRYENGEGVNQDYAEAWKWFRKAADLGHPQAFYELGMMCAQGKGVPVDFNEAVAWTRRAADAGFAPAQYNLGVAYQTGQGVPLNLIESYEWFSIASMSKDARSPSSNNNAVAARNYVAAQMSNEQRRQAELAVQQYLQTHRQAMLDNWVATGIVSCPRCDPAQGATSVTYVLSKEGVHHRSKKECEDTLPLFDQFKKNLQDQGMTTELKCINSPEPNSPAR
jgi:TPR repeat protein